MSLASGEVNRQGWMIWAIRSVRTCTASSLSLCCAQGPATWLTQETPSATSNASSANGFSSDQAGMPPAVMTMSSLSPLSRLSTWMEAISRAIGAIRAIMLGMASVVIARKRRASCPCVVISSSWRRATAIQTTPVKDTRMSSERTGSLPKNVSAEDAHRVPPAPLPARCPSPACASFGGWPFKGLGGSIAWWRKGGP